MAPLRPLHFFWHIRPPCTGLVGLCDSEQTLVHRQSAIRTPVAAKIALQVAGGVGGTGGSPTPAALSVLSTKWASTSGISFMAKMGWLWKLLSTAAPFWI